jgi:hypothetical protein
MMDSADPLDGWDLRDILQNSSTTSSGSATNDIYGRLFYQLRDLLSSFNVDVNDLPEQLQLQPRLGHGESNPQFARIEVSNTPH